MKDSSSLRICLSSLAGSQAQADCTFGRRAFARTSRALSRWAVRGTRRPFLAAPTDRPRRLCPRRP